MTRFFSTYMPDFITKTKALLYSQWFFPAILFYYGIAYVFWGEKYYLNDGFSMDGIVFSTFVKQFNGSYFFDTYYVHRIFPSFLVGGFFKLFSIPISNHHIFRAFQVLNLLSIILSCWYIKKTLALLKVSPRNQTLGLILFVFSFSVIKMPFFLAVMTDTVAMAISIMMLYFYLKKNTVGLVICTVLACFTWPMLFYQGIILLFIPFLLLTYSKVKPLTKWTIHLLSALFALLLCIYLVVVKQADTNVELVAKINRTLLPLSIAGVALLFYFFPSILLNASLLNIKTFFKKLKVVNILTAALVFGLTTLIVYYLNPVPSKFYPLYNILTGTVTSALMWPLHTIVSHTAFWGMIMILLMLFWFDFAKLLSQMGWGIVTAFSLNLFTFGIISETRCLVNLFPWVIVFLIKAINKYSFSTAFYIVVTCLSAFMSKIWFLLNPDRNMPYFMQLDKNGSMGFPDQKLWMHIGPWMSERMYQIQGAGIIVVIILIFFLLYRIEYGAEKRLKLIAKYKRA